MTGKFSLKMIWESVDWSIVAGCENQKSNHSLQAEFHRGHEDVKKTGIRNPKLLIYGKMIKLLQTFFSDTWTQLETLNLSRNQLTGLPVSEYSYPSFVDNSQLEQSFIVNVIYIYIP